MSKNASAENDHLLLLIGAALSSGSYSGVYLNHAELSPIFAGTLMGISNVVANLAPVIKPITQEYLLANEVKLASNLADFHVRFFTELLFVLISEI